MFCITDSFSVTLSPQLVKVEIRLLAATLHQTVTLSLSLFTCATSLALVGSMSSSMLQLVVSRWRELNGEHGGSEGAVLDFVDLVLEVVTGGDLVRRCGGEFGRI
jgi:hypothetical protein